MDRACFPGTLLSVGDITLREPRVGLACFPDALLSVGGITLLCVGCRVCRAEVHTLLTEESQTPCGVEYLPAPLPPVVVESRDVIKCLRQLHYLSVPADVCRGITS